MELFPEDLGTYNSKRITVENTLISSTPFLNIRTLFKINTLYGTHLYCSFIIEVVEGQNKNTKINPKYIYI